MNRTNILINEARNDWEVAALREDLGLEMTGVELDSEDAELRAHKELEALIDELGLEMTGVELDPDSAAELTLGGLLHRHTDNINIK